MRVRLYVGFLLRVNDNAFVQEGSMVLWKRASTIALMLLVVSAAGRAQVPIEYRVIVSDPSSKLYEVEALLPASGDTTLVSLPAWTPGHYEIENYARYVRRFQASEPGGAALRWDKLDPDTWRIFTRGSDRVRVSLEFYADTLNLSGSLLRRDFGFFNGTNLFVYAEGHYEYPARVSFELPEGWQVATELAEADEPGVFVADDYHQLVDNPTFLGHYAIDSVLVDSRWMRMAVYPARYFEDEPGGARELALQALARIARSARDLFGEPPYDRYTTFVYLEESALTFAGGLEHADSHLDIMPAAAFEYPTLTFRQFFYRLLSHEYYHAWNVKRIRPVEMWPYEYDRRQSTPLLWVAEGITDYYAHVMLTRTGLWGENEFVRAVHQWIVSVEGQLEQAVEDASVNTWMEPKFGDRYLYYDKGALLGLLLDIEIREATEDRHSLDDVMSALFREHYLKGRGYDTDDLLAYVGEFIGEDAARAFYRDYVDGREPLPYREVLASAALDFRVDTIIEPFFGVRVGPDREGRMIVREVVSGSAAARAGLRVRDHLKWVGSLEVADEDWGSAFKKMYADSIGAPLNVVYARDGREYRREVTVRGQTRYEYMLGLDESAGERRLERRRSILEGDGPLP